MGKGSFYGPGEAVCFVTACSVQVPNYCCILKIIYASLLLVLQNYDV